MSENTEYLRQLSEGALVLREAQVAVKILDLSYRRENLITELTALAGRIADLNERIDEAKADHMTISKELDLREKPAAYEAIDANGKFIACRVIATSMDDAKEKIEDQLTRNPSRLPYFLIWQDGGCKVRRAN